MTDHFDFRGTAVDRNRDHDRNKKWKSSKGVPVVNTRKSGDRIVPEKPQSAQLKKALKRTALNSDALNLQAREKLAHRKQKAIAYTIEDRELDESTSSDTYDEDQVHDAGDDIMYSYDANRGPSPLDAVFGQAVNKAVDKYEDGQTIKLVKNEYEVLDGVPDEDHGHPGRLGGIDSDDDFELV